MEYKIFQAVHNGLKFKIEEDFPEVGAYLYVYQDEKCIKDFLQNDVNSCKEFSYREYGVLLSIWI